MRAFNIEPGYTIEGRKIEVASTKCGVTRIWFENGEYEEYDENDWIDDVESD